MSLPKKVYISGEILQILQHYWGWGKEGNWNNFLARSFRCHKKNPKRRPINHQVVTFDKILQIWAGKFASGMSYKKVYL